MSERGFGKELHPLVASTRVDVDLLQRQVKESRRGATTNDNVGLLSNYVDAARRGESICCRGITRGISAEHDS
jgi:hypothetical protein